MMVLSSEINETVVISCVNAYFLTKGKELLQRSNYNLGLEGGVGVFPTPGAVPVYKGFMYT